MKIGLDAYLINLAIGVLTFFILRLVLKRIIKTNKTLRISLTWIGTIILTPIIYIGIIFLIFSWMFYEPTRDFSKERWFSEKQKRYEMRDDIVESDFLKNKNKAEVLNLLGSPDFRTDTTNVWEYDLGTSGAGFGWQFNSLLVKFDHEQVSKVEKREIVD
ncbi:MAG: hypothetical protein HOP08_04815 [Cyclobacteriaceae bacterium]|nr:hypothetical protein [Cyclobacteriaceae bacterium]